MDNQLTFLSEVDGIDYEIEFSVFFNHTHITHVKLDSIHRIDRGPSDSTLWTKLAIGSLDEEIKRKFIKQAELMAQGVCLQVPEREYFTEVDQERY